MTAPVGQYHSIEAEAERLDTSVRHIRGLIQDGKIPHVKVGRLLRFDPVAVDEWLDARGGAR